jgi:ABC-type sugar transport system substrate-binding protein
MHTDVVDSADSDAIINSARSRGVPVVTARQMLTWLDGRNASTFGSMSWNGSSLSFSISAAQGANGLVAMVPLSNNQSVSRITNNGSAVPFSTATIKGIRYVRFGASNGTYQINF